MDLLKGRESNFQGEILYPNSEESANVAEVNEETSSKRSSWWQWSSPPPAKEDPISKEEFEKTIDSKTYANWCSEKIEAGSLNLMNVSTFGPRAKITPKQNDISGQMSILTTPPLTCFARFNKYRSMRGGDWEIDLPDSKELVVSEAIIRGIGSENAPFSVDGETFEYFDIHVKVLPGFLTTFDTSL